MRILAPIDGSECSFAALSFAIEFATRFDGSLDVVHITDVADEATDQLVERARADLATADADAEVEVITHLDLDRVGVSSRIGRHLLTMVEDRDYDHVVMGRHGGGRLERLVLGSASEAVLERATVPVTVISRRKPRPSGWG